MASDGIACYILIQNKQLEQVNTLPYLGSLITEDGECHTRLNRGQAIGTSLHSGGSKAGRAMPPPLAGGLTIEVLVHLTSVMSL